MYALGIPKSQYRRCTQVLGPERAEPVTYNAEKQQDGFYLFSFPNIDEYDFKDIVLSLKKNGITTIGADEQLTEKNIMKLTNLLKEQGNPDENNIIDLLDEMLERWNDPQYKGGVEGCQKSDHYNDDLQDFIEDMTEDKELDNIAMDTDSARDVSINERFQQLAGLKPLYELEGSFDARMQAAGDFSDKEMGDITSRDIGDTNPFMDDDDDRSPGEELASRTIEKLKQQYKGMSMQDMEDFSKEMVLHFLEGSTEAQATAKVFFAKRTI